MHIVAGDIVRLKPFRYTELMRTLDDQTLEVLTALVCNSGLSQSQSVGLVIKTRREEKIISTWPRERSPLRPHTEVTIVTYAEVAWPEGLMPGIPVEFLEKISRKE